MIKVMKKKTRDSTNLFGTLFLRNNSNSRLHPITKVKTWNRSGTVLLENVIFIVLNLAFIALLILFLSKQGSGVIVLEQSYAKNIALLIDEGKPVMEMRLNMQDAFDLAKENGISRENIVKIEGNIITVKLSSKGGYQYSFFNNVDVTSYPDISPEKNYIIKINGYK